MRRIGSITTQEHAVRFRDYLLTREIDSRVDAEEGEWGVWVFDEDRLDDAKTALDEFQAAPEAPRFQDAVEEANRKRQARLETEIAAKKRHINLRRRWEAPLTQRIPITLLLIVLSGAASFYVRFGDDRAALNVLQIARVADLGSGMIQWRVGLQEIRSGEVWRLITPIFLHFDPMHILFNMYALYMLGGPVEMIRGRWRYVAFVLVVGVVSNLAQYAHNGPTFGGMSGVVYGLFGYLWWKSRFAPREGFAVPRQMITMLIIFTVLGLVGALGPIANTAHLSGLVCGGLLAAAGTGLRRLRSA